MEIVTKYKALKQQLELQLTDSKLITELNSFESELIALSTAIPNSSADVTAINLQQCKNMLSAENERFVSIMNAIDALIYVADFETNELLFANKYLEEAFGNVVGQKCFSAFQKQTEVCSFCTNYLLLDPQRNANEPYVWEFYNQFTNRWYLAHDTKIMWNTGKFVRIEIAIDITERRRAEKELEEYKNSLEDLVSVRTNDLKQAQFENIKALISGEEKERARISQELHDGLGPLLSTLNIFMQGIGKVEDPKKIKEFAQKAQIVFKDIMQTVTEVSNNLSPHLIRKFGLFTAIKSYVEKNTKFSKVNFIFDFNLEKYTEAYCAKHGGNCVLKNGIDEIYGITLYRIIAELINNSIKHSNATEIRIEIFRQNHQLKLLYNDNGNGFELQATLNQTKGMGLNNIQQRIKNMNGSVRFESAPNKGFTADIAILCNCV